VKPIDAVLDELKDIYGGRANRRYGLSDVSQLQHGLQSAAIAEAQGAGAAFIAAALLHDIGHMVHDLGENPAADNVDDLHEELGAAWLRTHFGPDVTEPVRLHVPAKRYLCAADPGYFAKLSEDSVLSLKLQGGPMSPDEVAAFRREPHFEAAVRLRRIDEAAKDPAMPTPPLEHFLGYVGAALAERAR
jgi:phosphonate degradation associated HDIG domain protein